MAEKKDGKWIQKIDMKKGALRKTAKAKGSIAKDGDIKKSFIDKAAANKSGKFSKKTEKRAELAKTLSKMRKKK